MDTKELTYPVFEANQVLSSTHLNELFEYLEPRGRAASHEPADVGITHVCVLVDDIHDARRRLVDAGAEPFSDPVPIDTGANSGGWDLYVRDPDGIVLELFQPPAG